MGRQFAWAACACIRMRCAGIASSMPQWGSSMFKTYGIAGRTMVARQTRQSAARVRNNNWQGRSHAQYVV